MAPRPKALPARASKEPRHPFKATFMEAGPASRMPMPPVLLLVMVPILLAIAALHAGDRWRGLLLALAVASVPLTVLLWENVAALPLLWTGTVQGPMPAAQLTHSFQVLLLWGLVPAALAWTVLWVAPPSSPCPRMPLRPLDRAGMGAATTLVVVAVLGAGLAVGLRAFGLETALDAGLWSRVTPWQVVGLSLVAALAEELLFRGVVYSALVPVVGFAGGGIVQALLFGIIHAGYGDPVYVVAAAAFGLVQAYVSVRFGLVVAAMVHAQVNLVLLGWLSSGTIGVNLWIVAATLAFNLLIVIPAALACTRFRSATCPLSADSLGLPWTGGSRRSG